MIDRDRWRRSRALAVRRLRSFHARLDRVCARMNAGLFAIALALAILVFATAAFRVPDLLAQRLDPQSTGAALDD